MESRSWYEASKQLQSILEKSDEKPVRHYGENRAERRKREALERRGKLPKKTVPA